MKICFNNFIFATAKSLIRFPVLCNNQNNIYHEGIASQVFVLLSIFPINNAMKVFCVSEGRKLNSNLCSGIIFSRSLYGRFWFY